jgi:hypothetical protein
LSIAISSTRESFAFITTASRFIFWHPPIGCKGILTAALKSPFQFLSRLYKSKEILEIQIADTVKAWWMQPDGHYRRGAANGSVPLRSQERLYELITSSSS